MLAVKRPLDLSDPTTAAVRGREQAAGLLAEAMGSDSPVTRYRTLVRIFELAFGRGFREAGPAVTEFLSSNNLGYNRSEVETWLRVQHERTSKTVLEADVNALIPRMEQAAFDTLFNKAKWSHPDPERRPTRSFGSATTGGLGRPLAFTEGQQAEVQLQVMDPFGSYPMLLKCPVQAWPSDWCYPANIGVDEALSDPLSLWT